MKKSAQKLIILAAVLFALAYLGHAAYLWSQYGPPSGFCTKCLLYWGRHEFSGGNRHWVEHAPLKWSLSAGNRDEGPK